MQQYLKDLGPDLIDRGYSIVPIKPGYKYPKGLKNWQSLKATHEDVTRWSGNGFSGGGVGVICGSVIGVDIDILDEEIADKLTAWCRANLGEAPQRIGLAPKSLLVFRTDTPFTKLTSNTYIDIFENVQRIEILGDGQQFVAYAKHPETGDPYRWVNGPGLTDLQLTDLPVISLDQANRLIQFFETIVPTDWLLKDTSKSAGTLTRDPSGDPFENLVAKVELSTDRIREMLNDIRELADDRQEWIRVGQALHHQFEGSDEGFQLFDEWSSNASSYRDGRDDPPEVKWAGFVSDASRRALSFRYVIKLRNEIVALRDSAINTVSYDSTSTINVGGNDTGGTLLDRFLARYVFVETGNLVADMAKPPQYCLSKIDEFRNQTANIRHEVPAPTQAEPDKTKIAPVSNAWLVNPDRKSAQGGAYSPYEERYYIDAWGNGWINTFYMPEFKDRDGDISVFIEHMNYLFPCDTERKWFLDWMAFNVQRPGKRSKVTPLHVSVNHGTGRGWVVELLGLLLGRWNCTKTKMDVLSGEGNAGSYQEYLNQSLLCCVEEVKESSKRYGVSDRIRDILTEDELEVNIKFGAKKTQPVHTNFFFMSNHVDALVLTKEDRRVQVLGGPKLVREQAYYDRLYAWLVPGNVGALDAWLRARDISGFDWKRCTDTPGRQRMIAGNQTPTEVAFWDFVADVDRTAITYQGAVRRVQSFMEGGDFESIVDEKQILRLLKQYAVQHSQMKIDGKPVRPWLIGSWTNPENEEIRGFLQGAFY